MGERVRGHVVHGEERVSARGGELPAMADHGWSDVVPVEPSRGEAGAQITQQEAGAATQIHDDRLPRESGGDLLGEELPEGRAEALAVCLDHALEQLIVRGSAQRLVSRHESSLVFADGRVNCPGSSPGTQEQTDGGRATAEIDAQMRMVEISVRRVLSTVMLAI